MTIALLAALSAWASEPAVCKAQVAGAAIQARLDSTSIGFAEVLRIRVSATAPPEVKIGQPEFVGPVESAEVVGLDSFGPDRVGAMESRAWEIQVEPSRSGQLRLPAIRVRVTPSDSASVDAELAIGPIEVTADSGVTGRASELRDVPAGAPASRSPVSPRYLRWAGIAVLAATAVYALIQWIGRHRRVDLVRESLVAMERIERGVSPEEGRYRSAAQAACDVLRTYLERRYKLPATHQTTIEFLRDERTAESLPAERRNRLKDLLSLADVERFGAIGPSEEEWRKLASGIRSFLLAEPPE